MFRISLSRTLRDGALGLTLAAWLASAALAQSQQPGPPPAGPGPAGMQGGGAPAPGLPHGQRLDRLLEDVKATPAQREQIRKILQANRPEPGDRETMMRSYQDQLMQAFVAGDAKAAETARQQFMSHHDTASRRSVQVMLEVGKVLSPEQRRQLAEQMRQHAGPHEGGRPGGQGGGRGDGPR